MAALGTCLEQLRLIHRKAVKERRSCLYSVLDMSPLVSLYSGYDIEPMGLRYVVFSKGRYSLDAVYQ